MSTIYTRATKGSALTWTEGDANITNLNNDKIEDIVEDTSPQLGGDLDVNGQAIVSASNGNVRIEPNGSGNISLAPTTGKIILGALGFPTGTGTNGQVLTTNGSTDMSWTTVSGGISDVVSDTSPQLGGNLDVNSNSIVSTSNADINITPNGTGRVVLSGQKFPAGATAITGTVTDVDDVREPNTVTLSNPTGVESNAVITFTGSGVSSLGLTVGVEYKIWAPIGGGAFELALNIGGGSIAITDPGTITDVNYSVAGAGATNGQILTYNSTGLFWNNAPSGGIASVSADTAPMLGGNLNLNSFAINNSMNQDTTINTLGTGNINLNAAGKVVIDGLSWPVADGTNNQVLKTDGAGNLSFTTISSGISDVVADTTPQLGGNLDVNGQQIVSVSNGNIVIAPNGTGVTDLGAVSKVKITGGTSGQVLSTNGSGVLSWATSTPGETMALLNVTGNTLVSGTTFRKTLTTVSDPNNLVGTITSNAFSLAPGQYYMEIPTFTSTAAAGYSVRLYGNTSGSDLSWSDSGVVANRSLIPGDKKYFTVGATDSLELRSYSGSSSSNNSLVKLARVSTSLPSPTSTQDTASVTASGSGGPFSNGGWTTSTASGVTGSRSLNNPSYTFGSNKLGGGIGGTLDFWLFYSTGGATANSGTGFLANDTLALNQYRSIILRRQNYNNQFDWSNGSASELRLLGNLASSTWHHFSLQTTGNNTWYSWVNGVYKGSFSNSASFTSIHFGSAGLNNNDWPWQARFSNIRWSSSQRYTVSSNFSVPTAQYTWDSNTVMLFRGADNNPTTA